MLRGTNNVGTRLLIVDDNLAVRSLLRDYFRSFGYQVDLAQNGQEAMEWINRNGDIYCCIVSDIQMPIMDGLSLAQAVHAVYPELPILAVTAEPLRAMTRSSHFASVIAKPFKLSQMLLTVQDVCSV